MTAWLTGFASALSLILAIGAQNAFVLRQGLLRSHVFAVCFFCALSDAILISVGVFAADFLSDIAPWFQSALLWGGALFLLVYGARALLSAWRGGAHLTAKGEGQRLGQVLAATAAITWLNPHVYLDTVGLIGAVSATFENKEMFAFGAITASFTFFFGLGYGARALAPIFARPAAWRILDAAVGLLMWAIALALASRGIAGA